MSNRRARKPLAVPAVLHPKALLRIEQLLQLVPLTEASIYRKMALGDFPKPVRISERAVAWRWSDIQPLIDSYETVTDIDPNMATALAGAKRELVS